MLASIESMALFSGMAGEADFRIGRLSLRLDFRMTESLPTEVARHRRPPFLIRSRFRGIDHEDVFDAAPGEFGEGDFAGFAQLFGAGEGFVGELNLSAYHALMAGITTQCRQCDGATAPNPCEPSAQSRAIQFRSESQ